jgi:bifunctional non-homologous end joining protein LigD
VIEVVASVPIRAATSPATVPHPIVRSLAADGPMLPTLVDGLPRRQGWRFEPKWDGWRALAVVEDGRVDLRSRRGTDLAPHLPELLRPPVALSARRALLDGEVVVLRNGRPDFDAISGRLATRRLAGWAAHTDPATFVAFDILELDGKQLAEEPYTSRREALVGLGLDGLRWALTPSDADGDALWAATQDLGLEGVVAKDPRSTWRPCRSRRWLKAKHWRHGTFRVMGWAASTDKEPAGLVVGAPGAIGELRVVGVAPVHADRETRDVVMRLIDGLRIDRVPVLAPRWRRTVTWVEDSLVADVRYLERTPMGLLRHASARRVGSDTSSP